MDELKLEKHGRVTVATLNRPERRNALSLSLAAELTEAVADFVADDGQHVLVITGAGDKAFCSGADLLELRDGGPTGRTLPMAPEQDIAGIAACEKPVLCAINGVAIGGGAEIAMACDIRLASENAWFAFPEVERGFLAGVAAVTLARLMPLGAVMDMMLVGERVEAQEAWRLGFVQQVLPAADLMPEALRRADKMSRHSQSALRGTKKVLKFWRDRGMEEHHRYYQAVVQRVLLSGDYVEGLQAFAEKRPANFAKGWPDPLEKR